jgi:hypothetical protein
MNGIFTSKFTVIFYAQAKKTLAAAKTWEKTKVQFLVRHKSGRHYARLFRNGKGLTAG